MTVPAKMSDGAEVSSTVLLCDPGLISAKKSDKYFLLERIREKPGISGVAVHMGWRQLSTIPVDKVVH